MSTLAGGTVVDIRALPQEIRSRTFPGLLDLGIAISAGAAAGCVLPRRSAISALPGVGIAVALVPPLATVAIVATPLTLHTRSVARASEGLFAPVSAVPCTSKASFATSWFPGGTTIGEDGTADFFTLLGTGVDARFSELLQRAPVTRFDVSDQIRLHGARSPARRHHVVDRGTSDGRRTPRTPRRSRCAGNLSTTTPCPGK